MLQFGCPARTPKGNERERPTMNYDSKWIQMQPASLSNRTGPDIIYLVPRISSSFSSQVFNHLTCRDANYLTMPKNQFQRTFIVGCGCTAFTKVNGSTVSNSGIWFVQKLAERPKDNGRCKWYHEGNRLTLNTLEYRWDLRQAQRRCLMLVSCEAIIQVNHTIRTS